MSASTRLAILQRPGQPLDPVLATLGHWGFVCKSTSTTGELLGALGRQACDVVLLDAGSEDALEAIAAVSGDVRFRDLPVIVATSEDVEYVASQALALGAADVLALPLDDVELLERLRALTRLARIEVEVRRREATLARFGIAPPHGNPGLPGADRVGILLIGPAGPEQIQVMGALGHAVRVAYAETAEGALDRLRQQDHELALITGLRNLTQLERLCASIRSDSSLFDLPIMLVGQRGHFPERARPYEWGVSDVLFQPFHPGVLRLRVQSWVHQQRQRRRLRQVLLMKSPPPLVDPVTRLFGHGFLYDHLDQLISEAVRAETPLALVALAVDQMGLINREHGYAAGDRVLMHIGETVRRTCRAEDLPARVGGDRFAIVVKNASAGEAQQLGERIRGLIERAPLGLAGHRPVSISLRSGLADLYRGDDAVQLVDRAFERTRPLRRAS